MNNSSNTIMYENSYVIGQQATMSGATPTKVTMPATVDGVLRDIRITVLPDGEQRLDPTTLGALIIEYLNVANKVVLQSVSAVPYGTWSISREKTSVDLLNVPVASNMSVELQLRDILAALAPYNIWVDFVFWKKSIASRV